jgi:hypothetical protein
VLAWRSDPSSSGAAIDTRASTSLGVADRESLAAVREHRPQTPQTRNHADKNAIRLGPTTLNPVAQRLDDRREVETLRQSRRSILGRAFTAPRRCRPTLRLRQAKPGCEEIKVDELTKPRWSPETSKGRPQPRSESCASRQLLRRERAKRTQRVRRPVNDRARLSRRMVSDPRTSHRVVTGAARALIARRPCRPSVGRALHRARLSRRMVSDPRTSHRVVTGAAR